MNRFFGRRNKKKKEPAPNLDDVSARMEKRGDALETKIKKLDAELLVYRKKMRKAKGAAKLSLKKRAIRVLKQRKMYEKQRDQVMNQTFNLDQTKNALDTVKETQIIVETMKNTSKILKKQYKEINIDEIEDLHDDMSDMMEDADEISEVLGRSYGVPEEVDEDDLMDELDALELDEDLDDVKDEVPNYLVSAASAANKDMPAVAVPQKNKGVEVDQFGLPKVPVKNTIEKCKQKSVLDSFARNARNNAS